MRGEEKMSGAAGAGGELVRVKQEPGCPLPGSPRLPQGSPQALPRLFAPVASPAITIQQSPRSNHKPEATSQLSQASSVPATKRGDGGRRLKAIK